MTGAHLGAHLWDAWAVFGSPRQAAISIAFLLLTYFGPGMVKTWLTDAPATFS